jgi:hypothetical protein
MRRREVWWTSECQNVETQNSNDEIKIRAYSELKDESHNPFEESKVHDNFEVFSGPSQFKKHDIDDNLEEMKQPDFD